MSSSLDTEKKISVIVPCFNEENNLDKFLKRLSYSLNEIKLDYNIIFIDDGSSDNTWGKISSFANNNDKITSIKLSRNFGQEYALKVGIDNANGDYIFSLDADLQDPPELLREMIIKMKNENLNVVYAQRTKNNENFFKKYSSYFFYFIFNKVCKFKIPQQVSDFKLIDKKILNELKKIQENDIFFRGLIPWTGFKSGFVKFERQKRLYGKTGMTVSSMIDHALRGIFNFSNFPMRVSFFITTLMIFIFAIISLYALISYFSGNVIRGWTSILLVISFLSIAIFFILGLISEYVGRIYQEVKKRPQYIIEDKIN